MSCNQICTWRMVGAQGNKTLLTSHCTQGKWFSILSSWKGLLKNSYGLPFVIPVIKHTPWQKKLILIPAPIKNKYTKLVYKQVRTGLYEQSTSSYSSPAWCKLWIVHDLQEMNRVAFSNRKIHWSFCRKSMLWPRQYGWIQQTGINSGIKITYYFWRSTWIFSTYQTSSRGDQPSSSIPRINNLQDEIPEHDGVFIDNNGIKGPKTRYGQQ
jgi:hypothetical protein